MISHETKSLFRPAAVFWIAAALALSLLLSGCLASPPMSLAQPDLTFSQMQDIPLDVRRIDIVEEYRAPGAGFHVEHEFPTPPLKAVRNLAQNKLLPQGHEAKTLRIYIEDASVRMEKLPVRNDFIGLFVREPSERYMARVSLRFELVRDAAPDIVIGRANISSDRISTIQENASLAERDQAYLRLTEDLMRDIYDGFRSVIRSNFGMPR